MKVRGSIKKGVAEVLLAGIQNDVRVGSLNAGKREHRFREAAELILASELRDDYAILNSSNIIHHADGAHPRDLIQYLKELALRERNLGLEY